MDDALLLAITVGIWIIAPIAVFVLAQRATTQLAERQGLLRYAVVCILIPFSVFFILLALPDVSQEKYPHMTPGMFWAGIPATIYLLGANAYYVAKPIVGAFR